MKPLLSPTQTNKFWNVMVFELCINKKNLWSLLSVHKQHSLHLFSKFTLCFKVSIVDKKTSVAIIRLDNNMIKYTIFMQCTHTCTIAEGGESLKNARESVHQIPTESVENPTTEKLIRLSSQLSTKYKVPLGVESMMYKWPLEHTSTRMVVHENATTKEIFVWKETSIHHWVCIYTLMVHSSHIAV